MRKGNNMKKTIIASCLGLAIATSASIQAEEINTGEGFVLGGKLGVLDPDSDRQIDDDTFLEFFGGYRFGPEWEINLGYVIGDYKADNPLYNEAEIDPGYSLSALYHFANTEWQPYISAGITNLTYEYKGVTNYESDAGNNLAAAVGIKRFINPSVFVSGELKHVLDSKEADTLISIGLGYMFNQVDNKPALKPVPAPVAPSDLDKDGVIDANDSCPNTPAGVAVDNMGCALDSDKDGVADYKDQCPNSTANAEVNAKGCEAEFITKGASIAISVEFVTNSSELTGEYKQELQKVADFMQEYKDSKLVIEGHTDSSGAAAYNKMLSQKRADKVMTALINQFAIESTRLSAVGYGEERPIADNNTAEGRQKNRRVVGVVEGKKTIRKN